MTMMRLLPSFAFAAMALTSMFSVDGTIVESPPVDESETRLLGRVSSFASTRGSNNDGHRDLQLLDLACSLVSQILPGELTCECALSLQLEFSCTGFDQLCFSNFLEGYCATPTVAGVLDLATFSVTFEFCGFDATNGGDPVPGLCINVGGTLIPPDDESSAVATAPKKNKTAKKQKSVSSKKPTEEKPMEEDPTALNYTSPFRSYLDTCSATISKSAFEKEETQSCKACKICNQGQGYQFDCSNFGRKMVQSACIPIRVLSNLRLDQNITFLPRLDVPKPSPTSAPKPSPTSAPTRAPVMKSPVHAWGSLFVIMPKSTPTIVNTIKRPTAPASNNNNNEST